jgi:hypothetical protein
MASSYVDRSQSNIYLDDPDSYHQNQNVYHLPSQYSVSTMNMPSMIAASTLVPSSSILKNATSMQQLKDSTVKMNNRPSNITDQETMIMDQNSSQQQSILSIPDVCEQQLINERLMCIQQMITSGQNFASMFNDDPYFAQQIMAYMPSGNYYQPQEDEPQMMDE